MLFNNSILAQPPFAIKNGVTFDGVNDYIRWLHNIAMTEFSVSLVFKNWVAGQYIFGVEGITGFSYDIWIRVESPGVVQIGQRKTGTNRINVSIPTIRDSSLKTLTFTRIDQNPNNAKVFLDGVELAKTIIESTLIEDISIFNYLSIARAIGVVYSQIEIFDVKLWKCALSPAEVVELYNLKIPRKNDLLQDLRLENVYRAGVNVYTPALVRNFGEVLGYPAGSPCIINQAGANVQLTP